MVLVDVIPRSQEALKEDIRRLEEWLLKQPHLPNVVQKDILSSFVVGTKSLEIAKRKLDAYCSWRGRLPNIFSFSVRDGRDPYFKQCSRAGYVVSVYNIKKELVLNLEVIPPKLGVMEKSPTSVELRKIFKTQLFFLPKASPEGYRLMFLACKFTDALSKFFDHDQTVAAIFMSFELASRLWPDMEEVYMIIDMATFSLSHATMLRINTLQACIRCFLESVPARFKGATVFNAGNFINILYNSALRPFLSEKLSERITITANDERSLQNRIPLELLPSDYGGNEKSSSQLFADWLTLLEENRDWFKMTSSLVADESKRPADITDSFGTEGTFRKLDID